MDETTWKAFEELLDEAKTGLLKPNWYRMMMMMMMIHSVRMS